MELTIKINKDSIENEIRGLLYKFEPDRYSRYGESPEFGDKCLTEEEYRSNVQSFLEDFRKATSDLQSIIDNFPKKKNGTFNRRNVVELASCNNCQYICEWHNTWIYYVVKVNAFDDHALTVSFYEKVDTPA